MSSVFSAGPGRSWLFVPADRPERAAKACGLPTDVIVLELEDGVTRELKGIARGNAGELLVSLDVGNRRLAIRINRITDPDGIKDLQALGSWARHPDLIVLPKVESGHEVRIYAEYLDAVGVASALVPSIENARGLLAAPEIAASPRVAALLFGGGDLSLDLGCRLEWEPLLPHRALVLVAGASSGVPVIDVPFIDVKDDPGLRREAEAARALGMRGKVCIHPAQLKIVNEAFQASAAEIERARRILKAAETGQGSLLVDGQLVDIPLLELARRVVAEADRREADLE